MKVYISGPISGQVEGNKKSFQNAQERIENWGHVAINPHKICSSIPDGAKWESFMKICKAALQDCDVLVYLPGWENSRGAIAEFHDAMQTGIPIQSLNFFLESHLEKIR